MREIKFRAWDPSVKCMITPSVIGEFGQYYFTDRDYEDGRSQKDGLMQYTGLKDKNWVDVFEGDIVKCFHDGDLVGNYDVIEFSDSAFVFRYRFTTVCQWLDFDGHLEVIGNIYENSNLLNP